MKIKFKSLSRRALGKNRPGSVVELSEAEAMEFLNRGVAVPVKEDATETTDIPVEEQAETPEAPAIPDNNPAPLIPEKIRGFFKKKKRK